MSFYLRGVTVWLLFWSLSGCRGTTAGAGGVWVDELYPPQHRAGLLELRWRREINQQVGLDWNPLARAAPGVNADGSRLYVGSNDNGLYSLRASDGAMLWRFETLGKVDATPVIDQSEVFFGSTDGAFYSLDERTGRMRWRVPTTGEINQAPVLFRQSVIFVNSNDTITAVGREDGSARWRYRRNPPGGITLSGHAGLTASGTRLFTGFSDGVVACLEMTDGSVVWEQDTSVDIENLDERNEAHEAIDVDTAPVVLGDTVYAANYTGGVYALDVIGGGRRWRREDIVHVVSLAADARWLYVASATQGLMKLDPYNGDLLWRREFPTRALSSVASLRADLLAVSSFDQALYLVRTSDGEPVDGLHPGGRGFAAGPAVRGSQLFAYSNGGILYAARLLQRN